MYCRQECCANLVFPASGMYCHCVNTVSGYPVMKSFGIKTVTVGERRRPQGDAPLIAFVPVACSRARPLSLSLSALTYYLHTGTSVLRSSVRQPAEHCLWFHIDWHSVLPSLVCCSLSPLFSSFSFSSVVSVANFSVYLLILLLSFFSWFWNLFVSACISLLSVVVFSMFFCQSFSFI